MGIFFGWGMIRIVFVFMCSFVLWLVSMFEGQERSCRCNRSKLKHPKTSWIWMRWWDGWLDLCVFLIKRNDLTISSTSRVATFEPGRCFAGWWQMVRLGYCRGASQNIPKWWLRWRINVGLGLSVFIHILHAFIRIKKSRAFLSTSAELWSTND